MVSLRRPPLLPHSNIPPPGAHLMRHSGSPEGSKELREDATMLSTLRRWALCPDPILQRCGVGALAKVAQSGVGQGHDGGLGMGSSRSTLCLLSQYLWMGQDA